MASHVVGEGMCPSMCKVVIREYFEGFSFLEGGHEVIHYATLQHALNPCLCYLHRQWSMLFEKGGYVVGGLH